ncbi:hypothetical protein [Lichenicola sp.]|uniref:hypothetical protein n=1 Tax=Lichenicola sp. TaxID=2804529 RepID=UPI003B00BE04
MSDKQSQILAALERWEQRFNGLEKGLDRFRVDVMDRIDRLHDTATGIREDIRTKSSMSTRSE